MAVQPQAALSLILRDGRILCVWNRRYNGWGLPGGKVEEGETVEDAQRRELLEETGLETRLAEKIYAAPTVSSDSGRQVYVFAVDPVVLPAETPYTHEEGSPIDWKTPLDLLDSSPFRDFYHRMFTKLWGPEGQGEEA